MSLDFSLTPRERLIKARVQFQRENPFFSYLTMELTFIEDKSIETMGVDKYGNLYYNPEFVDKLSDAELKGCIAHEVMHCAFEHLDRGFGREMLVFNISADTVVNAILLNEKLQLPADSILPYNNEIKLFGLEIKNVHKKTSEEVYDKLWRHLSKKHNRDINRINRGISNSKDGKNWDKHIFDSKENGNKGNKDKDKGSGNKSKNKPNFKEKNWKKKLVEACSHARERGRLPAGMERIVGKLLETYIDWRGLLYRYITSQIPVDYTWSKPSKRSFSIGYYLPAVEKETIEVMCAVDTSGSISKKELTEFISEISSITNSFKNVELTVIDCDAEINGVHNLKNATASSVINKIAPNLKGGGGTSHLPVFNWINKNKPTAKFVICFTDGYTEFPPQSEINHPILWVLAGNWRQSKDRFPYGKVIELPNKGDWD